MSAHDATRLRSALGRLQLGQREAARLLNVHERDFRAMCSGREPVPHAVWLALKLLEQEGGHR